MEPSSPKQLATWERMQALINAFPSLKRREMDWGTGNALLFMGQCQGMASGERAAALFVLHVWNPDQEKRWRFDFTAAMRVWDQQHIDVVRAWMANPWYA